jgi:hypothetical protein
MPAGSFLRLNAYWNVAMPFASVSAVLEAAVPFGLVIVKTTVDPATGDPPPETDAIILAVWLRV